MGIKLSFLVNLLNPEAVVVGGGFEVAGDFFLEEINRTVKEFSFSEERKNLKITLSSLRNKATSLGAAHFILEKK